MPCTYCHNINHTLKNCTRDISTFIQQFRDFVATNPYAMLQQCIFLNNYSKPVLTLMCKRVGLNTSGNKFLIACKIVKKYFECYSDIFDINNAEIEADVITSQIYQSYDILQTWLPGKPEIQAWGLEMRQKLDIHHTRIFGTSISLTRFLILFQSNQLLHVADSKAHLQKLHINVTINAELTPQECFMCCDENKHLAELGCGHNYCTDCVINIAKSRTKSVITCAICREEVSSIKVGTDEIRAAVTARLAAE